jgi:peptidyl-prolyl cis-trans isomerase SurA
MIKNKKLIILVFLSIFLSFKLFAITNIFVVYKVENEIITNIDIENESRYLVALNNQLNNLSEEKILEIAKDSILKETIKKIELLKYFELDQTNPFLETVIKDFYLKLKMNNKSEFQDYLSNYNLLIEDIKRKIEVETTWNQMVYNKYKNQININEKKLKQKIKKRKISQKKKLYSLTEITFEKEQEQSLSDKIKKIDESIKEIGFKNTANIYSMSDSSKFGGNIGWVEEKNLSDKLSKELKKLKIGEHTQPLLIGSNYLILKIEDIKNEKIQIDAKKELEKMILFEKERQLKQFSKIYFNKVKINTDISEL